jgi:PAS domain S-box-containing protein
MQALGSLRAGGGLDNLAVLYVEDDEEIREQLAQFLRRRVGKLYTADNGRSGLEAYHRYRPDIVVSDIRMPEMDGLEMAERIKRASSPAPIILTSAFSDTDYFLRAIDIGIDKYVLKPIRIDALEAALHRVADALQVQSELQLAATVFQTVSEAILVTDAKRRLIAVNPAFEHMTGIGRGEALGRDVAFLDSEQDDVPPSWRRLADIGAGKSEVLVRRRDGRTFTGWATVDTVRRQDGTVAYVVFVLTDISERKAAEEALRRMNEMLEARVRERTASLEQANRELESFSYSVSHDLVAPLRGIDGLSRMLEEDCADTLDERGLDYLRRIRAGTRRMQQLIDDLLSLARVSRVEMARRQCSLSDLANGILDELQQHQPERLVQRAVAPGLTVTADPNLMHIVLDNLLRNAWKFTSKHETARIEVGVQESGGRTIYHVRDDGAGFDMNYAAKLFSPFQRLHRVADFEGSGIGLAIVERIIERHGGSVWAEGVVEQGATFHFTLGASAEPV